MAANPANTKEVEAVPVSELIFPDSKNARAIPEVKFIEHVEEFCAKRNPVCVVAGLQDLHSKYKYSESGLIAQKVALKTKMPEIESALQLVRQLQKKQAAKVSGETVDDLEVTYQLSENIFAHADVPMNDKIWLWLGANTMLEYSLDEAEELLAGNYTNAQTTLVTTKEDLVFLKDQVTTCEVNIARFHNYGVTLRQKDEQKASKESTSSGEQSSA